MSPEQQDVDKAAKDGANSAVAAATPVQGYGPALQRTALAVGAAHVFLAAMWFGWLPFMGDDGGTSSAAEWYTCYLIEESLSLDNLFAFFLVFRFFKVPLESQNRVLLWGVVGAVVMRATMVGAGAVMVHSFHHVLLLFACVLLYQGYQIASGGDGDDDEEDLENNRVIKFARALIPVSSEYRGSQFFVMQKGGWKATPLMLVLVCIELSDVVFAIDSVPAAFGVTQKALVIYTANMFAIASLRSLYSVVAHAVDDLPYLQKAIGVVLCFIGLKMLLESAGFALGNTMSLVVVLATLSGGVAMSLLSKRRRLTDPEFQVV